MIIVRIIGGLGNQMFQYAFYKNLKEKYKNVKCDIIGYDNYKLHNGFDLENSFELKVDKATLAEVRKATNFYDRNLFSRIYRKIFGNKPTHILESNYDKNNFSASGNLYIDGYWQSDQFFGDQDNLRTDLKFKNVPQDLDLANSIVATNSVSLHVRRGDYVGNNVYAQLDHTYYVNALQYYKEKIDNPVFYVFSDDLEWAEKQLLESYKTEFSIIYPVKAGLSVIDDLQMMSLCKHNIIANSSFSWWAAWLNKNDSKIVVCPKKWYNDNQVNSMHLDKMPQKWFAL